MKKRNIAWPYFLFWNGFEKGLQPEEKGKSPAKKSSTPRSGRRRRSAISPAAAIEQPPSSSKTNKAKRNLDFSEKGQEAEAHQENVLNLPYSYSEEEQGEDAALALQIVPFTEALPPPHHRNKRNQQKGLPPANLEAKRSISY